MFSIYLRTAMFPVWLFSATVQQLVGGSDNAIGQ